jgi:hypothetical protein
MKPYCYARKSGSWYQVVRAVGQVDLEVVLDFIPTGVRASVLAFRLNLSPS